MHSDTQCEHKLEPVFVLKVARVPAQSDLAGDGWLRSRVVLFKRDTETLETSSPLKRQLHSRFCFAVDMMVKEAVTPAGKLRRFMDFA